MKLITQQEQTECLQTIKSEYFEYLLECSTYQARLFFCSLANILQYSAFGIVGELILPTVKYQKLSRSELARTALEQAHLDFLKLKCNQTQLLVDFVLRFLATNLSIFSVDRVSGIEIVHKVARKENCLVTFLREEEGEIVFTHDLLEEMMVAYQASVVIDPEFSRRLAQLYTEEHKSAQVSKSYNSRSKE